MLDLPHAQAGEEHLNAGLLPAWPEMTGRD